MYTETDLCSICLMLLSSSLASFIIGAWEKQLLSFAINSSTVSSSQDSITHHTAHVDFLKTSVLKSLSLTLQAWSTSSIQSLKACLFLPLNILIESNIISFDLSLLALVSPWKASCWLLWLVAIISKDLDCILASSINVALRSWSRIDPKGDWW